MATINEPDLAYDKAYTYADYLTFDLDFMVELIRGKIFKMTPAPSMRHQEISGNLHAIVWSFFRNDPCKVYAAPTDIVLPIANMKKEKSHTVVQPDLCVICDLSILDKQSAFGAPTLVVEILSPHTKKKDLQLKYEIYEEAGVQEYWIIMPEEELLEQFVLLDNKYERIQTYTREDKIISRALKGLTVELREVFKK